MFGMKRSGADGRGPGVVGVGCCFGDTLFAFYSLKETSYSMKQREKHMLVKKQKMQGLLFLKPRGRKKELLPIKNKREGGLLTWFICSQENCPLHLAVQWLGRDLPTGWCMCFSMSCVL